jgi:hypothetical protein
MKYKILVLFVIIITLLSIISITNLIVGQEKFEMNDQVKHPVIDDPSYLISNRTENSEYLNNTTEYYIIIKMENLSKGKLYLHFGSELDPSEEAIHIYLTIISLSSKMNWTHEEKVENGFGKFDGREKVDIENDGDYMLFVQSDNIDSIFLKATFVKSFPYYSSIIICFLDLALIGALVYLKISSFYKQKKEKKNNRD